VITSVTLALEPADVQRLQEEADGYRATRSQRHPPIGMRTAGSYFKNLPPANPGGRRTAAGILLDQVGAKELSVGDAGVFEKHASIVVNLGAATARQVLQLTAEMAARVKKRFQVNLEPEVRFVGKRPAL